MFAGLYDVFGLRFFGQWSRIGTFMDKTHLILDRDYAILDTYLVPLDRDKIILDM
jgi:hypothetical protein